MDFSKDYIIVKVKPGAKCLKKYWNKKAVYNKRKNILQEYHGYDNYPKCSYGSVFMIPTDDDIEFI
jgi:hypothetical protein